MEYHVQPHFFRQRLHGARDGAMTVRENFTRRPRGAERLYESPFEWSQHAVFVVAEIVHIDREAPLRLESNNIAHPVHESGVAAGRQRHHRSFLERVETEVEGDEQVDHADAVKEAATPSPIDSIAGAREGARRGIVAIAVNDEDTGLLERRNKEDCGVRLVMADVKDLGQTLTAELALQIVTQPEVQEHDATLLRRLSRGKQKAKAGGQPAKNRLKCS